MKTHYHTLILGTGAASLCAAIRLYRSGIEDLLIVTDNLLGGTSRNTGSDKQTYYKLSDSTKTPDSPYSMAKALYGGGSMHGDIALAEALGSESGFYHLTGLGVPFPFNKFGGYTGYKTDHDPLNRGTSLGPYTSRVMVEYLEREVKRLRIPLLDKHDCIKLVTVEENEKKRIAGVVLLDKTNLGNAQGRIKGILCDNLIFGVGGPGGLYKDSVYPPAHIGSIGLALEIGAETSSLTESQYGLGSLKFRWNLSGSYQQVIPRYFSRDKKTGQEYDFLNPFFSSMTQLCQAIFLKGYQWPFDPKKIENEGSSLIDILVYRESQILGRDVFIDFRTNITSDARLGSFHASLLDKETSQYWSQSGLTGETPIERLKQLNPKAIELYLDHNINLFKEPLAVGVCAQHNNGGLAGDVWWESTNIDHLFPIGEVNGSHGVYRPGGTALNSGQVGAFRASQKIAGSYRTCTLDKEKALNRLNLSLDEMRELSRMISSGDDNSNTREYRREIQARMTMYAAFVRDAEKIEKACQEALEQQKRYGEIRVNKIEQLPHALRNRHLVLAQRFYLEAIRDYLKQGGGSRGSYIVKDTKGEIFHDRLETEWKGKKDDGSLTNKIQHLSHEDGRIRVSWEDCRPIPEDDFWFETTWSDFLDHSVFNRD